MSTTLATVFRFEAAHRLPQLGGACTNLHGHSWAATVHLSGPVDPGTGIIVDLSAVKTAVGAWIAGHLDHTTILHPGDPLGDALHAHGCTVYRMPAGMWPSVENLAGHLGEQARQALIDANLHHDATITGVDLAETARTRAAWTP